MLATALRIGGDEELAPALRQELRLDDEALLQKRLSIYRNNRTTNYGEHLKRRSP